MANEFIIKNGFQSKGNSQITGSLSVTGGITGSYTGSFTGDGSGLTGLVSSSYAVTASYADNALSAINTPNAVITASNTGNDDTIEFLKGGGGAFAVTVNNVVSSSYALTASYALSSPAGTDTNFANTDLTFTGDRVHDTAGNNFWVTGDAGGFNEAYLGFQYLSAMGGLITQSYLAAGTNIFEAYSLPGAAVNYVRMSAGNDPAIYADPGGVYFNPNIADMDFLFSTNADTNTLFIEGSSGLVGIGKNTPNSVLDVNGNTIITGSLTVTGTASYLKSVVSASNSGGAVTVAMTEATYPSSQVIKLNCNQGTSAIQYTLPAVTEGLHYTFTGQGTTGINDGPVRFVGPAANTITGMVACSDGNDIIHTAAARVATTTMSFADGEFRNGSKVDFVCDGTNWVVTGVHGGTTSTITLS